MKPKLTLKHRFVEFIPDNLDEGTIYISMEFATVSHKCVCGCGLEVVTPISPTDWKLIFDGESISLDPSIGNWGFPCQSHYWIKNNKIEWSHKWSQQRINAGREYDLQRKQQHFHEKDTQEEQEIKNGNQENHPRKSFWQKVKSWLS